MPGQLILFITLTSILLLSLFTTPTLSTTTATAVDDDSADEDLSFLEEDDANDAATEHSSQDHFDDDGFYDSEDDDDDSYNDSSFDHEDDEAEADLHPKVDEKDVVVLTERNFSEFIESNKYVMVKFYAPWCDHCKAMAPEYAAAATELKAFEFEKVVLAKVDATEEGELAEDYEVEGFPTVHFFVHGKHIPYPGQRSKKGIVTWIKKRIGPGVVNVTTLQDAESILTSEDKFVLAFLNSWTGAESDELAAASKLHDDVNFYQTINSEVAKLFHLDPNGKPPSVVLLKKEAEKVSKFCNGNFSKSEIDDFVSANKLPLVTTFTRESASMIFESTIKKQVMLFATSKSKKIINIFQEAAKEFKGKLLFVYVKTDDEDTGKPVAEYFGVEGDAPKVLGYTGVDDPQRYIFDEEITIEGIKRFGADLLEDKVKPFYKSDPIPETNEGDVKIVVGNTFDEVVLDESKDVLLEIYAPWCGHCQAFEPTYNRLAKHLHGVPSLVIAKMDGTSNEHPKAKADGFPTLVFFPAGNKRNSDPIIVETEKTVVALYKFIKKHASIPFKIPKQASSQNSDHKEQTQSTATDDVKDEL